MKTQSKFVVVTGTSSGIGYGAAKELIKRGYHVFGSVRKQEDADRVQLELGNNFTSLLFDVTDDDAIVKAVDVVKAKLNGQGLGALINNSGVSVVGPMEHLNIEKVKHNFDVNVLGIFRVTKAFLPLLGTQKDHPSLPGRVLNISSVAGKLAGPYLSPYVGTKHAVEGISHCLRIELLPFGIDVVIIGPGAVQTPIWDKGSAEEFKNTRYIAHLVKYVSSFVQSGKKGMTLDECSNRIADILETPNPKVRYAIVKNKFTRWTLPTLMSYKMIDNFFKKNLYAK